MFGVLLPVESWGRGSSFFLAHRSRFPSPDIPKEFGF